MSEPDQRPTGADTARRNRRLLVILVVVGVAMYLGIILRWHFGR